MSSDVVIANVVRFFVLFLVQILILINVEINSNYVNLYLYPVFLFLLPIRMEKVLLLIIAFIMGISIDFFYDSSGVHAATSVFTVYLRSGILRLVEPRGGYEANHAPTKQQFGARWFYQYTGFLLFLHLLLVFLLEVFNFVGFGTIMLKTILSFLLSMLLVVIYVSIFNPRK
jgi:hypothetical protein